MRFSTDVKAEADRWTRQGARSAWPPWPSVKFCSPLFWCLPEPSRSYLFTCWLVSLYVNLTCGSPLDLFGSPSAEIDIHQNSWNSVSVPPISMLVIAFKPFLYSLVDIKMVLIYYQQAPPNLPFARPWAKINSVMDQELLQCFHASKVHMRSKKNSL